MTTVVAATAGPAIGRRRPTLEGGEALPAPGTRGGHPTHKGMGATRVETVVSAAGGGVGAPLGGMMSGEEGRVGVTDGQGEAVIGGGESTMTGEEEGRATGAGEAAENPLEEAFTPMEEEGGVTIGHKVRYRRRGVRVVAWEGRGGKKANRAL